MKIKLFLVIIFLSISNLVNAEIINNLQLNCFTEEYALDNLKNDSYVFLLDKNTNNVKLYYLPVFFNQFTFDKIFSVNIFVSQSIDNIEWRPNFSYIVLNDKLLFPVGMEINGVYKSSLNTDKLKIKVIILYKNN